MQVHRTKPEESIYDIAKEYGVSPIKIAEDNDVEIRGCLPPGRELLILTPSRSYNVKSDDTLDKIAIRFKTSKEALLRLNRELRGLEKLYQGQLLTIKDSTPNQGMIAVNGYIYMDTPRERIVSLMPYLSYVTVCSAVYRDGSIHTIFPSDEAVAIAKGYGRIPIVRIYLTELPGLDEEKDFAGSVELLAHSHGFSGVTLSSLNSKTNDKKRMESIVLSLRKQLMQSDLILFAEGDIESETSYMEYADAGILTYDKLHKPNIPTFSDGERAAFENFAYSQESCRAFVEIPSFAYSGGRYVEKREAMRITDKKRGIIENDDERKIQTASYGKHKKTDIIYESLENTIAKLGLISELGYMGVCFDIGRVAIADLMAISSMFDVISRPAMAPKACHDM